MFINIVNINIYQNKSTVNKIIQFVDSAALFICRKAFALSCIAFITIQYLANACIKSQDVFNVLHNGSLLSFFELAKNI